MAHINETSRIAAVLPYAFILTIFICCVSLAFRYYRLSHIPGPIVASLTDFWSALRTWSGTYHHELICELHKQYGPVVRFGPNRVSFSQPAAIPSIYGTSQVFQKAPSYGPLVPMANGQEVPTLVTIRDEKRVSELKKHISAGFSTSTWLKQEDQIDSVLTTFIDCLHVKSGQEIRLDDWLRYWSFDALTLLAFSESREYLKLEADIDGVYPAGRDRFAHWRLWSAMPKLEAFLFKNGLAQKLQKTTSALAQLAMRQIHLRQSGEKGAAGNDLLGRYLAASQQAPDVMASRDVLALTISTIHAGSETTALTTAATFANLLTHPSAFEELKRELLQADLKVPAPFADIDKLSYLDACIRETMRLSINPNVTERTVSAGGASICDTWIPAGTDVSIAEALVCRDPAVFGPDVHAFKPERWLTTDEKQWREMDRANFGFSWGRRVCIGQHLAAIQLKKVIAALIVSFEISLVEPPKRGYKDNNGYTKLKVRLAPRA